MQTTPKIERLRSWKIEYDSNSVVIVSKKGGVGIFQLCQNLLINSHVLALTPCPKASTGLVAIAKNKESLHHFRKDKHELHFVFVAVCFGGFKKKEFCITDDISGRKASTRVKVLSSHESNCAGQISLVELTCMNKPFYREQFRRHLYSIGHPIIGKVACTKKLKNHKNKLCLSCIRIFSPDKKICVEIPHPRYILKLIECETKYYLKSKTPSETYKDGQCIFMGNQYIVNKNCFIPKRSSEVLIEVAYDIVTQNIRNSFSILDCGTGSGCLLLSFLLKCMRMGIGERICHSVGIDISDKAIEVAKRNAKNLCLARDNNVSFVQKSFNNVADLNYAFDIVICNPPYLTSNLADKILNKGILEEEPSLAYLVPSEDHLLYYRQVAINISKQPTAETCIASSKCTKRRKYDHNLDSRLAKPILRRGGTLIFEVPHYLIQDCTKMLLALGYINVAVHKDKNGFDRCISCMRGNILSSD